MTALFSSEVLLTWMIAYGSPVMAVVLFLGAMGLPFPVTLTVIAAGALARLDYLNASTAGVLGLVGCVAGDMVIYALGRSSNRWIQSRLGRSAVWAKARTLIDQRGGAAIYLTRWLITAPALPVSLLAGSARYPFRKFLLYDAAGEVTWIVVYGSLGYAFGSQWETLSAAITQYSTPVIAAAAAAAALVLVVRYWLSRPHTAYAATALTK